jgi:hypothetical protein
MMLHIYSFFFNCQIYYTTCNQGIRNTKGGKDKYSEGGSKRAHRRDTKDHQQTKQPKQMLKQE